MPHRFQLPILIESTACIPEGLKRFTADVLGLRPPVAMPPNRLAVHQQQQHQRPRPSYYNQQQGQQQQQHHSATQDGVSFDSNADISSEPELSDTAMWNFHHVECRRKSVTPVTSQGSVCARKPDECQPVNQVSRGSQQPHRLASSDEPVRISAPAIPHYRLAAATAIPRQSPVSLMGDKANNAAAHAPPPPWAKSTASQVARLRQLVVQRGTAAAPDGDASAEQRSNSFA